MWYEQVTMKHYNILIKQELKKLVNMLIALYLYIHHKYKLDIVQHIPD